AHPHKARGIEGLATPLIGRERELDALRRAFEETVAGRGQFILLLGEAGVGKSRLVAELAKATNDERPTTKVSDLSPASVVGRSALVAFLEGRCLDREVAASYGPFVDALRQCVGWGVGGDEGAPLRELAEAGGLNPERAAEVALFLGHLVALPPGTEESARLE